MSSQMVRLTSSEIESIMEGLAAIDADMGDLADRLEQAHLSILLNDYSNEG